LIFTKTLSGKFYNIAKVQIGKPKVPQQYLRIMANMRTSSQNSKLADLKHEYEPFPVYEREDAVRETSQ